ncbi:MAG: NnrU family protein [Gammaproteobacteria bacterium]|nr:NnrU family protein [Gammaproteobacteria bacterium]MDH5654058.1 NnrU family protein [Gammaproteobacteria bacterium]
MISLIVAVNFFVCIHMFISGTGLRDKLILQVGEKKYLGIFSVLSLVGLIWMIFAYSHSPYFELWGQVTGLRWLAAVLILLAFLFVVIGIMTGSPTALGGEALLDKEESATGILRITRHPFLVGTSIWSATHLVYNGDLAAVIFFGGFLALSLFGMKSIDNKQRMAYGANWQRFEQQTSGLPFLAILQGRNRFSFIEIGIWRTAAALLAYVIVLKLHAGLFGVSVISTAP